MAWTSASAADSSIEDPSCLTSEATKPANSDGLTSTVLCLGHPGELAQPGEQPAALLATAVHEHERDVLDRR